MSFGVRKNKPTGQPLSSSKSGSGDPSQDDDSPSYQSLRLGEQTIRVSNYTRMKGFIMPSVLITAMIILFIISPFYGAPGAVGNHANQTTLAPQCFSFAGGRPVSSKNKYFNPRTHAFKGGARRLQMFQAALEKVEKATRLCRDDYCPKREQDAFRKVTIDLANKRARLYDIYFIEYGEPGLAYLNKRFSGFRDVRLVDQIRARYKEHKIQNSRNNIAATALEMLLKRPISEFGPCRT